ncbi:hypothetical protein TRFO_23280 [Tritrichomonas foetus]|uniref:Uncharacterized protein n=1 Tax=Tritrichomonas foetus TaxID=1144522 RepID=A0A1J4KBC3_9EUKA|nr:hypothetical protein TRFO_23280 [Tritrichomonas foetus]|eukprot:OHT08266.1 hypothetical protein TRFO_23280 [Tritrichomonas foetus]
MWNNSRTPLSPISSPVNQQVPANLSLLNSAIAIDTLDWPFLDTMDPVFFQSKESSHILKQISRLFVRTSIVSLGQPQRTLRLLQILQVIITRLSNKCEKHKEKVEDYHAKNKILKSKLEKALQKPKTVTQIVADKCPICLKPFKSLPYLDIHVFSKHQEVATLWQAIRTPQPQGAFAFPWMKSHTMTSTMYPQSTSNVSDMAIQQILNEFKQKFTVEQKASEREMQEWISKKMCKVESKIDNLQQTAKQEIIASKSKRVHKPHKSKHQKGKNHNKDKNDKNKKDEKNENKRAEGNVKNSDFDPQQPFPSSHSNKSSIHTVNSPQSIQSSQPTGTYQQDAPVQQLKELPPPPKRDLINEKDSTLTSTNTNEQQPIPLIKNTTQSSDYLNYLSNTNFQSPPPKIGKAASDAEYDSLTDERGQNKLINNQNNNNHLNNSSDSRNDAFNMPSEYDYDEFVSDAKTVNQSKNQNKVQNQQSKPNNSNDNYNQYNDPYGDTYGDTYGETYGTTEFMRDYQIYKENLAKNNQNDYSQNYSSEDGYTKQLNKIAGNDLTKAVPPPGKSLIKHSDSAGEISQEETIPPPESIPYGSNNNAFFYDGEEDQQYYSEDRKFPHGFNAASSSIDNEPGEYDEDSLEAPKNQRNRYHQNPDNDDPDYQNLDYDNPEYYNNYSGNQNQQKNTPPIKTSTIIENNNELYAYLEPYGSEEGETTASPNYDLPDFTSSSPKPFGSKRKSGKGLLTPTTKEQFQLNGFSGSMKKLPSEKFMKETYARPKEDINQIVDEIMDYSENDY